MIIIVIMIPSIKRQKDRDGVKKRPGLPNFAPPHNCFLTILLFFSALCWGRYSNARLVFPYLSLVAALAHPYQTQNTLLNTERSNLGQNHSQPAWSWLYHVSSKYIFSFGRPTNQTHWNCWSKRSPSSALFPCTLAWLYHARFLKLHF